MNKKLLCLWFKNLENRDELQRQYKSVLAPWAYKLSPLVALDCLLPWAEKQEPFSRLFLGMHLDLTGSEKLHGDELGLMKSMNEELLAMGGQGCTAVAPMAPGVGEADRHLDQRDEQGVELDSAR